MQIGDGTLREIQLRRSSGGRTLFKDVENNEANNRLLRETYISSTISLKIYSGEKDPLSLSRGTN
jgi:hypothetical protein